MLRPDAETDFLAFSLPDALTISLCGLESLVVRSSLAASRFGGDGLDPRKIGAEADVDVIVAGTLVRTGDGIRVSCQLTDASAGTLLWSHTTDVPVGNLFQVHDELVHRIVDSLSLPLTARERRMLQNDVPSSKRAYEDFLRANQLSLDAKQWSVARDLYERCVEDDPRYAPAWARLGRIRHVMAKYLETGKEEELDRAETAFRRALDTQCGPGNRSQALRSTRGRSRARPRCDGAPRGPGTKRRPRVVCWTGEHVPLLRFARGVARR